jgi:hypothetical protein
MELQQFSTTIFEAPDEDHIGRNMQGTSEVKNNLKIKIINFKILRQVCVWDGASK